MASYTFSVSNHKQMTPRRTENLKTRLLGEEKTHYGLFGSYSRSSENTMPHELQEILIINSQEESSQYFQPQSIKSKPLNISDDVFKEIFKYLNLDDMIALKSAGSSHLFKIIHRILEKREDYILYRQVKDFFAKVPECYTKEMQKSIFSVLCNQNTLEKFLIAAVGQHGLGSPKKDLEKLLADLPRGTFSLLERLTGPFRNLQIGGSILALLNFIMIIGVVPISMSPVYVQYSSPGEIIGIELGYILTAICVTLITLNYIEHLKKQNNEFVYDIHNTKQLKFVKYKPVEVARYCHGFFKFCNKILNYKATLQINEDSET